MSVRFVGILISCEWTLSSTFVLIGKQNNLLTYNSKI